MRGWLENPCKKVTEMIFCVSVTKPVSVIGQTVMGDDAGIEARSSKDEARASSFHIRASIRVSTTTDVNFNLTIWASFP
jgi:hypothetical protein